MARGQIDPILLVALGLGGYWLFTRQTAGAAPVFPTGLRTGATPRMTTPRADNYNQWVQTSLNRLMGCGLKVDGIIGPLTKACLIRFQEMWNLVERGTIGPETDYYIKSALGTPGYIEEPFTY